VSPALRLLRSPVAWHYAGLAGSLVAILVLGRTQWFYYDEWSLLVPRGLEALVAPHVGHWSGAPTILTWALRAVVGLEVYWPYLLLSVLVHLAITHVLWRLMRRMGVQPWIATALALLAALLGAGAENIFWEFQVGYMGAILVGLAVLRLLDSETWNVRRAVVGGVLAVVAVTFSGTAIPVLVAAGLVGLRRRGVLRTALVLGPAAVVYVAWYLLSGARGSSEWSVKGPTGILVDVPRYIGHMFADGLGTLFPIEGFGVVVCAGLVVALVVLARGAWSSTLPAFALVAAALLQAGLTGFSRIGLGFGAASSERYVYAIVVLILPFCGLVLSRLAGERRAVLAAIVALLVLLTGFNAGLLARAAQQQGTLETATKERLWAVLDLASQPGAAYDPAIVPAPYAPGVSVGELLEMEREGWLEPGPYGRTAELEARVYLDLGLAPSPDSADPDAPGCHVVAPETFLDTSRTADVFGSGAVRIALVSADVVSDWRPVTLTPDGVRVDATRTTANLRITALDAPITVCDGVS